MSAPCALCPRACGAVRAERPGFCGAGERLRVSLAQLHFGEEPCLSGEGPDAGGSGTIFFSGCALRCVFCQNHDISIGAPDGEDLGQEIGVDDLVAVMLELQLAGAHNVNLVTPSHFTPQVREALILAKGHGLVIPVVWNSGGYESVEALRTLEGLVDVYLPDLKYMDAQAAARYSAAPDYPAVATRAIHEMHRQAGRLVVEDGLARRGVLTRVLVLPGNLGRADLALEWIAGTLGAGSWVSLMGQYYPAHRAREFPELSRSVSPAEYAAVQERMEELDLLGHVQQVGGSPDWTPDFRNASR